MAYNQFIIPEISSLEKLKPLDDIRKIFYDVFIPDSHQQKISMPIENGPIFSDDEFVRKQHHAVLQGIYLDYTDIDRLVNMAERRDCIMEITYDIIKRNSKNGSHYVSVTIVTFIKQVLPPKNVNEITKNKVKSSHKKMNKTFND